MNWAGDNDTFLLPPASVERIFIYMCMIMDVGEFLETRKNLIVMANFL